MKKMKYVVSLWFFIIFQSVGTAVLGEVVSKTSSEPGGSPGIENGVLISEITRQEIKRLKGEAHAGVKQTRQSARSVKLVAGIHVARREGDLIWGIASNNDGTATPNILSELSHLDLEMNELEVNLQTHFTRGWLRAMVLESRLRYGNIAHGQTQDSDYLGDNRTDEFSRSLSANTGDYAADYSFALGYQKAFGRFLNLKGWFGYGKHEQFIRIEDAVQVLETPNKTPPLGPLEGLNTTYQGTWEGAWLGLEANVKVGRLWFSGRFEHHNANYYAEANWNLRDTFAHPRSFEHLAEGQGDVLDLGVWYGVPLLKGSKVSLGVAVRTQRWQASDGLDRVFFSNGKELTTRLNEVDWQSSSLRFGIHYYR